MNGKSSFAKRRGQYKGRTGGAIGAMRKYNGAAARINRFTGANRSRQLVSVPAYLRARSNGVGTEIKSVDGNSYSTEAGGTAINLVSPAGGAAAQVLMLMPLEGSSFYNRIARRTRGISLEVRGHIKPTLANAAAKGLQYARIMIIYDRQANGAVPALSAILSDYDFGGNQTTFSQSGVNMDNRDRFLIIRDRKFLLPPIGINGVAPTTTSVGITTTNADMKDSCMNFTEFIKLNGLETQYKASSGGGIGDVSTGSFLIVAIDETDTSTSGWALTFHTRYKFYD